MKKLGIILILLMFCCPVWAGTSTQANTRISTVPTAALLQLVGVDLSAYPPGTKITITANGKTLVGYMGPAGGEALGSEKITADWTVTIGTLSIFTVNANHHDIDAAVNTSAAAAYARASVITDANGSLVKWVYTRTVGSGETPTIFASTGSNGAGQALAILTAASGSYYFNSYVNAAVANVAYIWNFVNNNSSWSATHSLKRVTDVAVTGAKIYTSAALATQSWASNDGIDANYSGGYTYTIESTSTRINNIQIF